MGNQASTFNVNIPGWRRFDQGDRNTSRFTYLTYVSDDGRHPLEITIETPIFGSYIMTIKQGILSTTVRGDLKTFGPFLRERYGRQVEPPIMNLAENNTTDITNMPLVHQ